MRLLRPRWSTAGVVVNATVAAPADGRHIGPGAAAAAPVDDVMRVELSGGGMRMNIQIMHEQVIKGIATLSTLGQ